METGKGCGLRGRFALGAICLGFTVACNNPGGGTTNENRRAGGDAVNGGSSTDAPVHQPGRSQRLALFDFFNPESALGSAGGEGGEGNRSLGPPYGISESCGDAIVGDDEECDDGAGGEDACSAGCQTRDQPVGAPVENPQDANDRYLGVGRHPLAGLADGFISAYVEEGEGGATVGATLFNIWGQPEHRVTVSEGAAAIYEANPVAAALPGGDYAVAWSDFDGDGSDLGVALRRVDGDGVLGPLRAANGGKEFSQLNPDMIWSDSQLIVAWEDYTDAFNGPDVRVRTFDEDLNPTSDDVALADTSLPEASVALAPFHGGWAAAYREGSADGQESIVVKAAQKTFRIGTFVGGPIDDRPALVGLDQTHLLVAFSVQTDPSLTGSFDISRIRYAVIDTAGTLTPASQSLDPLDDVYTRDLFVSQMSPSLSPGDGGAYLAWRSEARPGDAAGDQLWLKALGWSAQATPPLEARRAEMLIPRTCESSVGDQRRPQLAPVALPPAGALAIAWDDYSHSQGLGNPDVVVHYAPMHAADLQYGNVFTEPFTSLNGAGWSSHWSSMDVPALTLSIASEEGRITAGASGGTQIAWVNHLSAQNVDLVVKVDYGAGGVIPGLIARRTDDNTYLAVRFPLSWADPWRIFGVRNGAEVSIATGTAPVMFGVYGDIVYSYLRFRVTDNPDGTIDVRARTWVLGADEPDTWQVQGTVPIVGADEKALLGQALTERAGRFGVYAKMTAGSRFAAYDDFKATSFADTYPEADDSELLTARLPLKRTHASYRSCTGDAPCTQEAEGCCLDDSECAEGLSCTVAAARAFGLGSQAKTCIVDHCANHVLDEALGEQRTDCGGPDCPPCICDSPITRLPGAASYCSANQNCLCDVGGTDCSTHADCLPGLLCGQERGWRYGFQWGSDACTPNHCYDFVQSGDETGPDCGGSCGSCACSGSENGGYQHCTVFCPCEIGHGDCDYKLDCVGDAICGSGVGMGLNFSVCLPAHCGNSMKDTALGETSADAGGPCASPDPSTLAAMMPDFPTLQYRKVTYALETGDFAAVPNPSPPATPLTTPTLKNKNRFIFTVPATGDVSMTFAVTNPGVGASAIDLKVYNTLGSTVKTAVLPSTNGTVSTTVLIGRLGAGSYDLDLTPQDLALTYTITRPGNIALGFKEGADVTGPVAPLYFFVPVETDTGFLFGNFDAATPVQFWDPSGAAVTPIVVSSKVYAIDTHGKHGIWKTSFRTSSLRAHLVNLPDVLSFDPGAVVTSKIIRTGLDLGPAPAAEVTSQYLRYENHFVFHVATTSSPVFNIVVENSALQEPLAVWVQKLNGEHLPNSPFRLMPTATYPLDVGVLEPGDYELRIPTPNTSTRYKIVTPAGVPLISVDGFLTGNVWLASYRDYFYVPPGVSNVRFASPTPSSIFVIYDPSGTAVANQPVSLGNGVYEIQNTTPGTWAMNVKGATSIRFVNIVQHIGFEPGIQATPLPSPPYSCTSNANCAADEVCGTNNGARFGRPASDDLCWQPSCASSPPAGLCGSVLSPCGTCP
jgi:hypothetical protein